MSVEGGRFFEGIDRMVLIEEEEEEDRGDSFLFFFFNKKMELKRFQVVQEEKNTCFFIESFRLLISDRESFERQVFLFNSFLKF